MSIFYEKTQTIDCLELSKKEIDLNQKHLSRTVHFLRKNSNKQPSWIVQKTGFSLKNSLRVLKQDWANEASTRAFIANNCPFYNNNCLINDSNRPPYNIRPLQTELSRNIHTFNPCPQAPVREQQRTILFAKTVSWLITHNHRPPNKHTEDAYISTFKPHHSSKATSMLK